MDPFTAARIRMSSTTGAEVKRFARVRKEGFEDEYDFKTSARKEKLGIASRFYVSSIEVRDEEAIVHPRSSSSAISLRRLTVRPVRKG